MGESVEEEVVVEAAKPEVIVNTETKRKPTFKEKFEFESIEKELPILEAKKKELEEKLNFGISDHTELQAISEQIQKISDELEEKGLRWLELSELVS